MIDFLLFASLPCEGVPMQPVTVSDQAEALSAFPPFSQEERKSFSEKQWVRTQDFLCEWYEGADGLRLSSQEVVELYGPLTLQKALTGTVHLVCHNSEPSASIVRCREARGWSQYDLAVQAQIMVEDVADAENQNRCTSMDVLLKIGTAFGIDGRLFSFQQFGLKKRARV